MTTTRRARILVADDESLNRRLIQAILAPEGYEIIHAADGARALELVAQGNLDLVLLDVMMPGLDGIEVCRRICDEHDQPLLPVIVISALTDPTSRTRAKAVGAADFLTKPIHEDELLVRVRNLLLLRERHVQTEQLRAEAQGEARRWRLASSVANGVAGHLDYQSVTTAIFDHLERELGVEVTAFYEPCDRGLRLVAFTPGSAPDHVSRTWDVQHEHLDARRIASGDPLAQPFQPVLDGYGLTELVILPIVTDQTLRGLFCLGRKAAFTATDVQLLVDVSPHVANAIATVRSHDATILRLVRHESERQRIETALRASEERHRILFDASPFPIWVFDPRTFAILAVNDALVRVLGYSREELLAMRVPQLKPAEDLPHLVNGMLKAKSGETEHVGVLRYLCKDRTFVEFDITAHTTKIDGNLVKLAIGVDVTHSRKIEDQLRQAQKMEAIGQLAGGVAHDFNNILAGILGCAELALDAVGEDHAATTDLKEIDAAAHRAAGLTRQLLAFSRKQRRDLTVLALNAVVTNVEKMLARIVGEDIEMSAMLAPQLGSIEADAGQIEQVLMNLVVNARDAMPTGGRLSIETSNAELDKPLASQLGVEPGRFVMLAVSDTGCGMDVETRRRVFEPFFTTKEVGKGTGLGLSTVFGIVKQSGGGISISSEIGKGSTFRIYLPRLDVVPSVPEPMTRTPAAVAEGIQRVLLVEDDDRLRAVIGRQLKAWGYTLLEACNATSALELVQKMAEPVDLLLTDLVMPGIDGRALATILLADRPNTKVLFMSGYMEHPAVKTAKLGAKDQFIEKPFTALGLSSAIRRALGA